MTIAKKEGGQTPPSDDLLFGKTIIKSFALLNQKLYKGDKKWQQ